jgi:endo-1,4-beta-xylanase
MAWLATRIDIRTCVHGRAALLSLALLGSADAASASDCREPGADCTLREVAAQAGVGIGTIREGGAEVDAVIGAEFNSLTVTTYWAGVHPEPGIYDFQASDATLAFAEAHGMQTRGHTLLWDQESLDTTPDWVTSMSDPDALRALMREHISTVVGRYRGRIGAWDVVNEPIETLGSEPYENVFRRVLGPGYIAEALQIAHEADPDAALFVNEIVIGLGPAFAAKLEAFLELVRDLVDRGAPIHGVGFQAHFFLPSDAAWVHAALREIEALGLTVELTEMDVPQRAAEDPDALQREEYHQVVAACLAVPACQRITVWGVSDAHSWLNWFLAPDLKPLLFDDAYARKRSYEGVRDALLAYVPRDLSGERLLVRDHATHAEQRRLWVVSKDPSLTAAGAVRFGDPTQLGGSLRLRNPLTGEDASFELPASGWTALGDPPGSSGYVFDGPDRACRNALVIPGQKLVIRCRGGGIDFTLDEPRQGRLVLELRLGDAPLQCLDFGSGIQRDEGTGGAGAGRFQARRSAASSRCAGGPTELEPAAAR